MFSFLRIERSVSFGLSVQFPSDWVFNFTGIRNSHPVHAGGDIAVVQAATVALPRSPLPRAIADRDTIGTAHPHGRDTVAYGADPEHTGLDVELLIHCGLHERSYESAVANVRGTPNVHYLICTPTRFGVMLYVAAHNKLEHLNRFGKQELGCFPFPDV